MEELADEVPLGRRFLTSFNYRSGSTIDRKIEGISCRGLGSLEGRV